MPAWYGLHVRSNEENNVAAKLTAAGIEAFYPFVLHKSKDGRREIEKKFMPGYVFGRFSLDEDTAVVGIRQVVGIVGAGRHAIAIPDYEIESCRKIVSFPELVQPCDFLAAGDRVRVKFGKLAGCEGIVERWKKKAWIVVSITTAARSMRAFVEPKSLELIAANAA